MPLIPGVVDSGRRTLVDRYQGQGRPTTAQSIDDILEKPVVSTLPLLPDVRVWQHRRARKDTVRLSLDGAAVVPYPYPDAAPDETLPWILVMASLTTGIDLDIGAPPLDEIWIVAGIHYRGTADANLQVNSTSLGTLDTGALTAATPQGIFGQFEEAGGIFVPAATFQAVPALNRQYIMQQFRGGLFARPLLEINVINALAAPNSIEIMVEIMKYPVDLAQSPPAGR